MKLTWVDSRRPVNVAFWTARSKSKLDARRSRAVGENFSDIRRSILGCSPKGDAFVADDCSNEALTSEGLFKLWALRGGGFGGGTLSNIKKKGNLLRPVSSETTSLTASAVDIKLYYTKCTFCSYLDCELEFFKASNEICLTKYPAALCCSTDFLYKRTSFTHCNARFVPLTQYTFAFQGKLTKVLGFELCPVDILS